MECINCYEEFEQRLDAPNLRVCSKCESDWLCPNCGWDSENLLGCDDAPVTYSEERPHWEWSIYGGCNWTEYWTCPECGTKFEVENGNV